MFLVCPEGLPPQKGSVATVALGAARTGKMIFEYFRPKKSTFLWKEPCQAAVTHHVRQGK